MNFASNLKELRTSRHLSQEDLAKLAGLRQSNISAWELGRSLPLPDGLCALANALECSVDYLLGREREDGIIVVNGQQRESVIPAELENIYIKLDSMHRNILIGIARNVLEAQKQGA